MFNKRGAIRRKIQTVATILTCNYYHLNAILENYKLKNVTSENNSKMKKHSAIYKIQGSDFIIPPGYIAAKLTTTTTLMPLKDDSIKNLQAISSKQSHKRTRSQSIEKEKQVLIIELDDKIIDQSINKKKFKKLTKRESIVIEIDK